MGRAKDSKNGTRMDGKARPAAKFSSHGSGQYSNPRGTVSSTFGLTWQGSPG